jgi:pimeloyl-ACP methyl ester carboxylesterase
MIRKLIVYAILLLGLTAMACRTATEAAPTPSLDPGTAPTQTAGSLPNQDPTASPAEPTTPPQPAYTPEFAPADCRFETPIGREVECGDLIVPEDRENPAAGSIRIHVAVFKTDNPSPLSDPVVYLAGGPGGETLSLSGLVFENQFAWLTEFRDLVLFDQRGVGLSQPSLECTEIETFSIEVLDEDVGGEEAATACRERLLAEGINLSAYNSVENAADLEDLRKALGYESWNLYGVSYGTRLALTTMRDHPAGIRSVVLDSAVPLEIDLYESQVSSFNRALNKLFAGCQADPGCAAAYPDLRTLFFDTVDQLEADPIVIEAFNYFTGESYEVLIDGASLMSTVFQALYVTDLLPTLPRMLDDVSNGMTTRLVQITSIFLSQMDLLSHGMHYSVQCNEDVVFNSPEEVTDSIAAYPELALGFEAPETIFQLCDLWQAGESAPLENLAVSSPIPTLIIAGEYDPVTPPSWGRQVGEQLANSIYFELPGSSHGASFDSPCGNGIVTGFLVNPLQRPDGSCINQMSDVVFIIPGVELNLVPFSNTDFGISGVVPAGWEEIAPGTFASEDAVVSQIGIPGTRADLLRDLMLNQLGVSTLIDPDNEAQIGAFNWKVYAFEAQGIQVYMATTDDSWGAYLVLVQPPPGDEAVYYDGVFLPILEAFTSTN